MEANKPTLDIRPDSARKVYVLNRDKNEYVEKFRGDMIHVPANEERKLLMGVMEANRFLSQAKAVYEPLPDGTYRPGQGVKALYIQELSDDERLEIEGITPEGRSAAESVAEYKAQMTCVDCGFLAKDSRGLKTHMTTIHPEMKALEEKPTKENLFDTSAVPELSSTEA